MIHSMTGFASRTGTFSPHSWSWELRAVNGKGLDLRLRVPDWVAGLEIGLRKILGAAITRGNITCNLRLARDEATATMQVNETQLAEVLNALHLIESRAMEAGVSLAPSKASDLVALRGILEEASGAEDTDPLCAALLADAAALIADFNAVRAQEGAALADVLSAQLSEIETLTAEAAQQAEVRRDEMAETLRRNLGKVLEHAEGADETRVAQELAMIAVKSDVTEELDRLGAHIVAARGLLADGGPVGRKLDFLMQEFNREANTLCAKAQNAALTRIGLALKVVIDRMREQVQNVE